METPWKKTRRRLRKNPRVLIGGGIIFIFTLIAFLAPYLTSYPIDGNYWEERLQPPSSEHWFGTDDFGRDLFTRVIYGARLSLWVGLVSVLGASIIGTLFGLIAGFFGRWVDQLISRIFDIMLAFPAILLAIAIVSILGPSLNNAILAVSIVNIPVFGRLVRAKVITVKEEEYITASRVIGTPTSRILLRHLLPNSLSPIIVQGTMSIATAILEAAALGFLNLGPPPPAAEWGKMLADSRSFIQLAPWTLIFPGCSIMLVVLGFNLLGDGMRDVLDPRNTD
ncbi:ABC transporter permease [Rubeoparvulum massiliense]|uniref:ABC transporter permease n=1 Tax=Rubeoparvulum massiliense TaxID=1631346 RepID=UPI00065E5ADC|nr:ABC transporter permease [Rubeoparvulum massiliense]